MKSFFRTFGLLLPGGFLLAYFAPDVSLWQFVLIQLTLFGCGMVNQCKG